MFKMGAETLVPSADLRTQLAQRGGESAARCYQCATCSSVCMLATADRPFPRRQMLAAQWGLSKQLAADPAVWLCHQCNDCSERCPRDAKPGDAMAAMRNLMVEELAVPKFLGWLTARAKALWPLLLGVPIAFWAVLVVLVGGFEPKGMALVYGNVVPHWLIYAVYFPVTGFVALTMLISCMKAWKIWSEQEPRTAGFVGSFVKAAIEVATHKRFSSCGATGRRRWGHFLLMWGFIGAAITSGFLIIVMYGFDMPLPLPQTHWIKILGNASAVLLAVGGLWLFLMRLGKTGAGSTAFDVFFLGVVLLLIATGIATELGRYYLDPTVAIWIYIVHLGTVLCLFVTFPYSKFAHLAYRTLAMVHDLSTAPTDRESA